MKKLSKLARIAGLCLIVSTPALMTFADPPPPEPCGCEYCSRAGYNKSCTIDGTTTTCGYFLSVAFCLPTGG
jgi:hypothetical protein